jgi:MAE_28990/MAE_18760-like HEPN
MNAANGDFEQRLKELKEYVQYLDTLEKKQGISITLMNTMKASTMLMIYNVIESTMTSLIESIFQHMQTTQTSFDSVNDSVKAIVLKNVRKIEPKKLVAKMSEQGFGLPFASFNRHEVFSGNVDHQKIREVLKEFGINLRTSVDGAVLHEVKIARNELAHGRSSFVEEGKNLSASALAIKVESVEKVLRKVVEAVTEYASSKSYG